MENKMKEYFKRYREKHRTKYNDYMRKYMRGKRYYTYESQKRTRDRINEKYGSFANYRKHLEEERPFKEWLLSFGYVEEA